MSEPKPGEVWLVDLGMSAKVRPCLVLSVPIEDRDRALVTLIPHTTAVRSSRFERVIPAPFLKEGAFDAQGIVTVPTVKLLRRIGSLQTDQLERSNVQLQLGSVCAVAAAFNLPIESKRHAI